MNPVSEDIKQFSYEILEKLQNKLSGRSNTWDIPDMVRQMVIHKLTKENWNKNNENP